MEICENCGKGCQFDDEDGILFCSVNCQMAHYLRKIKNGVEHYMDKNGY